MNRQEALSQFAFLAAVGVESAQFNTAHILDRKYCPPALSNDLQPVEQIGEWQGGTDPSVSLLQKHREEQTQEQHNKVEDSESTHKEGLGERGLSDEASSLAQVSRSEWASAFASADTASLTPVLLNYSLLTPYYSPVDTSSCDKRYVTADSTSHIYALLAFTVTLSQYYHKQSIIVCLCLCVSVSL